MQAKRLNLTKLIVRFIGSLLIFSFVSVGTASASGGGWTDKKYSVQGNWSIEQRGDQHVIVFDDTFNTKSGPDLKLFLSPLSIDDATGKNATKGSVLISALTTNTGAQEYVIPANIDLSAYQSLLIHCEKFSVLWGGANL